MDAGFVGLDLKTKIQVGLVARGALSRFGHEVGICRHAHAGRVRRIRGHAGRTGGHFGQPRHDFGPGKAAGGDVRLDGHRRVLKRRLAHHDFVQGKIGEAGVLAEHHRINWRTTLQRRQIVADVRGVAIREQKHARDRLAAPLFDRGFQGVTQRRGATGKVQFAEIANILNCVSNV